MKKYYHSLSLLTGTAAFLLTALPSYAISQQIDKVQVNKTLNRGLELKLKTNNKQKNISSFLSVSDDNKLETTLINTELNLPKGKTFTQTNPAPGIAKISLNQVDKNHTKIIVTTHTKINVEPTLHKEGTNLIFSLNPTQNKNNSSILNKIPLVSEIKSLKQNFDKLLVAQSNKDEQKSELDIKDESLNDDILVPNPEIIISNGAEEFNSNLPASTQQNYLPRAVAPPVGDMAVSNISTFPDTIQLNSNAIVPRLVLRDAPVREVLSLLARQAGLNIVFASDEEESQGGNRRRGEEEEVVEGPTVSLDLENQSVQEVFDSILLISGLNASRRGNIIYVGEQLPAQARNLISRTLRLNQVRSENAALFLASQGAQGQRLTTEVEETVDPETGKVVQRKELPASLQDLGGAGEEDGTKALLLQGLQIATDDRLNSITLIGEPRKVEMATAFLTQLDARRRQVAVNVKVVDVNLLNQDNFNSSVSFGLGDAYFLRDNTSSLLNFGGTNPAANSSVSRRPVGDETSIFEALPDADRLREITIPTPSSLPDEFLALIESQVTSGNAKILTDPTLTIQEGQQATVRLVQKIVESVETSIDGDSGTRTITPVIGEAGLVLTVNVERVDDNGFVSMSVSPAVSSIGATQVFDSGGAINELNLLSTREISSGLVRIRDNQTLILSGIIQDQERTSVSKVPILGDIPLLGSLFRSTNKTNERAEVVVLLTPQVIDEQAGFGYNYTPSKETREMLREGGLKLPGNP